MKFENNEMELRSSAYGGSYQQNLSQKQIYQQLTSKWSLEENKMFENALAIYDKDSPDKWEKVAAMIPGKTINDVLKHYEELEADVSCIEAGLVPLPHGYTTFSPYHHHPPDASAFTLDYWVNGNQQISSSYDDEFNSQNGFGVLVNNGGNSKRLVSVKTSGSEQDRKKGVPWTEEEHKLFLLGLKKYGKGDWRNISRNFVITRTPTQVASHAQKYFLRQHSGGKDRRRASIHDITIVNLNETRTHSPDHIAIGEHSPGMLPFQWNSSSNGTGFASMDFNDVYGFDSNRLGQRWHSNGSGMMESYIGSQSIGAFQMEPGKHYPLV